MSALYDIEKREQFEKKIRQVDQMIRWNIKIKKHSYDELVIHNEEENSRHSMINLELNYHDTIKSTPNDSSVQISSSTVDMLLLP